MADIEEIKLLIIQKLKPLNPNKIILFGSYAYGTSTNELYTDLRYPGDIELLPHGKPNIEDTKEFYNFVLEVYNRVCEILGVKNIVKINTIDLLKLKALK